MDASGLCAAPWHSCTHTSVHADYACMHACTLAQTCVEIWVLARQRAGNSDESRTRLLGFWYAQPSPELGEQNALRRMQFALYSRFVKYKSGQNELIRVYSQTARNRGKVACKIKACEFVSRKNRMVKCAKSVRVRTETPDSRASWRHAGLGTLFRFAPLIIEAKGCLYS